MHKVKATDLVNLRRTLASERPEVLAAVRERLSEAQKLTLDAAVASAWIPDPDLCALYEAFARALFPGAPNALIRLGRYNAGIAYRGVYRVFFAIPSVGFVLTRTAAMWSNYHSTGTASIEEQTSSSGIVVVRGAEAIQKSMIDIVTGHILAVGELTRAKDPLVHGDAKNPAELRWTMRWK